MEIKDVRRLPEMFQRWELGFWKQTTHSRNCLIWFNLVSKIQLGEKLFSCYIDSPCRFQPYCLSPVRWASLWGMTFNLILINKENANSRDVCDPRLVSWDQGDSQRQSFQRDFKRVLNCYWLWVKKIKFHQQPHLWKA